MTRNEMIERIIEAQFDNMDYKTLFHYFQAEQEHYYADASDEFIESEYIEFFGTPE